MANPPIRTDPGRTLNLTRRKRQSKSKRKIYLAGLFGFIALLLIGGVLLLTSRKKDVAQSQQTTSAEKPNSTTLPSIPSGRRIDVNSNSFLVQPSKSTSLDVEKPTPEQSAGDEPEMREKESEFDTEGASDDISDEIDHQTSPIDNTINPFETFPAAISLPPVDSNEATLQGISMSPNIDIVKIESILQPTIHVISKPQAAWEILGGSKKPNKANVHATVSRTVDNGLSWSWIKDIEPEAVTDLSNAWMHLERGDFSHSIALRIPVTMDGFDWDFKNNVAKKKYAQELSSVVLKNIPADSMNYVIVTMQGRVPDKIKMGNKLTIKIPSNKVRKRLKLPGTVIAEYRTSQTPEGSEDGKVTIEQRLSFRVDSVEAPLTDEHIKKRSNEIRKKLNTAQNAVNLANANLKRINGLINGAGNKYQGQRLQAELQELGGQQRNATAKLKNKIRVLKKYKLLFNVGLPNFQKAVLNQIRNKRVEVSIFAEKSSTKMERLQLATSDEAQADGFLQNSVDRFDQVD